ncbi:hydrogen peroxide-inducible genes activator [Microvirga thermotolerans]|uniref:LysR family transcriptional regulator n=1 Tax=Microvirga thermotolerans TaxID=2651334 RepID=A0A5P9JWM1_9HYPH|nr:hydrogen peroxide-inducible genes activator [Microvirga thermotolerans]QFU17212.1 LysR family transcriptional regulator [Microvirga thermotolerans]
MITLRQLRYLAAVAETRHFGRAAALCHVTQPALSMQIQELEQSLGLHLIERRRNAVDLTSEGREIARRAAAILASVADLEDYARREKPPLVGVLRLGIIPSIAPYLLPRALPLLHERHPELDLRIRETQTAALVEELVRGELDLVVAALPLDRPELDALTAFEDRFLVARQARAGRSADERMTPAALAGEHLLLLEEGHCLRDQALSVCGALSSDMPQAFGASSLSTVMHLVANGYGVTLLPEMAARAEGTDRVQLVRFTDPEPVRTIGLAWRRSSSRRNDAAALAKVLLDARAGDGPHL